MNNEAVRQGARSIIDAVRADDSTLVENLVASLTEEERPPLLRRLLGYALVNLKLEAATRIVALLGAAASRDIVAAVFCANACEAENITLLKWALARGIYDDTTISSLADPLQAAQDMARHRITPPDDPLARAGRILELRREAIARGQKGAEL